MTCYSDAQWFRFQAGPWIANLPGSPDTARAALLLRFEFRCSGHCLLCATQRNSNPTQASSGMRKCSLLTLLSLPTPAIADPYLGTEDGLGARPSR